ncbi:MAG: hypothetical protein AB7S48_15890 [Bacteroidales bacterium]
MERNEFLTINQETVRSWKFIKVFLILLFTYILVFIPITWIVEFSKQIPIREFLTFERLDWVLAYIFVFALVGAWGYRRVVLEISPSDIIDVDKVVAYFEGKKMVVKHRDENMVTMVNRRKFDLIFSAGMDFVEIIHDSKSFRIILASRKAYDVSHTFRWSKDFFIDNSNLTKL